MNIYVRLMFLQNLRVGNTPECVSQTAHSDGVWQFRIAEILCANRNLQLTLDDNRRARLRHVLFTNTAENGCCSCMIMIGPGGLCW